MRCDVWFISVWEWERALDLFLLWPVCVHGGEMSKLRRVQGTDTPSCPSLRFSSAPFFHSCRSDQSTCLCNPRNLWENNSLLHEWAEHFPAATARFTLWNTFRETLWPHKSCTTCASLINVLLIHNNLEHVSLSKSFQKWKL